MFASAEVGSSSCRTFGWKDMAFAISTICLFPALKSFYKCHGISAAIHLIYPSQYAAASFPVNHPMFHGHSAQQDIFRHIQSRYQAWILIDSCNSFSTAFFGLVNRISFPSRKNSPDVGLISLKILLIKWFTWPVFPTKHELSLSKLTLTSPKPVSGILFMFLVSAHSHNSCSSSISITPKSFICCSYLNCFRFLWFIPCPHMYAFTSAYCSVDVSPSIPEYTVLAACILLHRNSVLLLPGIYCSPSSFVISVQRRRFRTHISVLLYPHFLPS